MKQFVRSYDPWGRDEYRLLVGFGFLGFGILFWWCMRQDSETSGSDSWLVYVVVAMGVVPGLVFICLKHLLFVDPQRGQLIRAAFLVGFAVHRRSWTFSELRRVAVRHHGSGAEGFCSDVGVTLASGSPLWFRSFAKEPDTGPSEVALGFARELADTMGLECQIHRPNAV